MTNTFVIVKVLFRISE